MSRHVAAVALCVGGLVVAAVAGPTVAPVAADGTKQVDHDPVAKTVTMCGDAYCAVFDYNGAARLSSLTLNDREVLADDGIYSYLRTQDGEASSLALDTDPTVTVDGSQVTATFSTSLADETWTFQAGAGKLDFDLSRTYSGATSVTWQGTPLLSLAENAFDNVRWTGDGGNFPVGGQLANTYQHTWLAGGQQANSEIRVTKEQTAYTFLDRASRSALRIDGTTNHDDLVRGRATEIWRSEQKALRVAVLTAAENLRYANGNDLGYWGQATQDGTPVFEPVSAAAGQTDEVHLSFQPTAYEPYYDLGTLNGVDEDTLSQAINNYARWMMQDTKKGASTEMPPLKSEVPPLEMHYIGQLLELFPEDGALSSYQHGLEDIRDFLIAEDGSVTCCAPGDSGDWGVDYGDHASSYVLGVAKAYQLTGDADWLATMKDGADRSLDHLITDWTDPTTRFVRNVDPDLTETEYNNDYWESSTGEFNGYTTALLYDALMSWSRLERDVLGDAAKAEHFASIAATIKTNFNRDVAEGGFWSPDSQTFLYGSGNADALHLATNAEVLKTDLASQQRRTAVAQAIAAQNMAGNYDLHPLNVRDLFTPGATAPTDGKNGENGGWYGAPDGEFYAGIPLLGDPLIMQTAAASFLLRYFADGFHGASTWDRDQPLVGKFVEAYFPTSVMPAWGLYHYGFGFQPAYDRLVLEPFISKGMTGSAVRYRWRATPLRVTYDSPVAFRVSSEQPLPTPITVRWINQPPGQAVNVTVGQETRQITVDANGTATATVPAGTSGTTRLACESCRPPAQTDRAAELQALDAVTGFEPGSAPLRNDAYEQVGMRLSLENVVEISRLGRYKTPDNRQVHRVKLLDAEGRIVASAPVDMSREAADDGFVYTDLTEPVRVEPGEYYLYSSETPGGDTWYDVGGTVTTTPDVSVLSGAYGRDRTPAGGANTSYGPLTFSYSPVAVRRSS